MDGYNNNGMNPDAMMLNTAGIAAVSKALTATATATSSKGGPKYKKAPDAPKRFKSAFIIFSAQKHKEIKEDLISQGRTEKTTDIAKLVSEAWREMPPDEKEGWEKKASKDKARYEVEKSMYKGPWKVQANKRTPKDPTAPKRPMSAFLAFSNKRRAALKRENPDATNADLSKMLSITWKEIDDEIRKKYMDEEAGLRATYKVEVAKWRKKVADEKKIERTEREAIAMQTAEARAKEPQGGVGNPNHNMMNATNMNNMSVGANNNARNNQFNPGSMPNQANMVGMGGMPGQGQQQPLQQDMNVGGLPGGYGNPYGMPGGQLGQLGSFGMPGGPDAAQYASLMSGGSNPFATQPFMSNTSSSQQQLLQLFAGQQFNNPMGQGGGLGMYPGLAGQGMQGGFGNNMGGYGGFGGMPGGGGGGMDMAATQRAMLEAAQNVGPTSQLQQQKAQMMQQQGMNQFNPGGMGQMNNGFQGNMMGNMGGMMSANGGLPMGNEWMNQQQQHLMQQQPQYGTMPSNHRPPSQQQQDDSGKKDDEEDDDEPPQYR